MENNKRKSTIEIIGIVILLIGLAVLAYKCYEFRYFLFNLPQPSPHAPAEYYAAEYLREYIQQRPGSAPLVYFTAIGSYYAVAPIIVGLILIVVGRKKKF